MKLSKKITIFISIIFIVIFGIIIARYFVGKHFEKKFSQRPPPGVIVEVVDNSQFFEKIETFGTAGSLTLFACCYDWTATCGVGYIFIHT